MDELRAPPDPPRTHVVGPRVLASQACRNHPDVRAVFRCTRCGDRLCETCAEVKEVGDVAYETCRCSGLCAPFEAPAAGSLDEELRRVWSYPLAGGAVGLVLAGAGAMALVRELISGGGLVAFVPRILAFTFLTGYLVDLAFDVVSRTASGGDAPPEWPDFMDVFESGIVPLTRAGVLALAAFGPALFALGVFGGGSVAGWLLLVLGCACFPAGFAGLSTEGGYAALHPRRIAAVMLHEPAAYGAAALLFAALAMSTAAIGSVAEDLPFVGRLLGFVLVLYLLLAFARVLGLALRDAPAAPERYRSDS